MVRLHLSTWYSVVSCVGFGCGLRPVRSVIKTAVAVKDEMMETLACASNSLDCSMPVS